MINITKEQLRSAPRRIGKFKNGDAIFEMITKGGFAVILAKTAKGAKVLAGSPHIAVSKHIARTKYDDIEFSELSKAESDFDAKAMKPVIDLWSNFTDKYLNFGE